TVRTDRCSWAAIDLLAKPSATSRATSSSRSLSPLAGAEREAVVPKARAMASSRSRRLPSFQCATASAPSAASATACARSALGDITRQRLVDQVAGLREITFDDARQTEHRGRTRLADAVAPVAEDATSVVESGASYLDASARHRGQTLEEGRPPAEAILSDL